MTLSSFAGRWGGVGCSAVLCIVLRTGGIGHLLIWDEAADLCAYRAFAAGSNDYFAQRFWHHPPAFGSAVQLLAPLEPGIAERIEWMALLVNTSSLLVLAVFVRRVCGPATANWASFFLAVMPGAIFFDVWIKGGPFVVLFALCAFHAQVVGRFALAALCMGFAFLDKELAAFPAIAMGILALLDRRSRQVKCLVLMAGITAATAGWWYLIFSGSNRYFFQLAAGVSSDNWLWRRSWDYYAVRAFHDFGWWGIALLAAGVAELVARVVRRRPSPDDPVGTVVYQWWPLIMLVPAFVVLQAAHNKSPWLVTSLYPACATLQAVGAVALVATVRSVTGRYAGNRRWLHVAAAALASLALAGASLATVMTRSYESAQKNMGVGMYEQARVGHAAAAAFNRLATEDQPTLITSFYYNRDYFKLIPCPIFTWYMKRQPMVFRPYDLPFNEGLALITNYRLDWAVVSPEPGYAADNWRSEMARRGIALSAVIDFLRPVVPGDDSICEPEHAVYIFRTTPLHERPTNDDFGNR